MICARVITQYRETVARQATRKISILGDPIGSMRTKYLTEIQGSGTLPNDVPPMIVGCCK